MATVNETVRESIMSYPSLYSNRTQVLHFILAVIGNGYHWVDGEPVRQFEENGEPWTVECHEARLERDLANADSSIMREIIADLSEDDKRHCLGIQKTIEDRIHLWEDLNSAPYPQTEYALLMRMPEDVTADWREACEQMREFLGKRGWVF